MCLGWDRGHSRVSWWFLFGAAESHLCGPRLLMTAPEPAGCIPWRGLTRVVTVGRIYCYTFPIYFKIFGLFVFTFRMFHVDLQCSIFTYTLHN